MKGRFQRRIFGTITESVFSELRKKEWEMSRKMEMYISLLKGEMRKEKLNMNQSQFSVF